MSPTETSDRRMTAQDLLTRLRERGATLAVAESLTGGRLAAAVTAVPGASAVFRGGVVAYASDVKMSVLGVPAEQVAEHGVVSAECAAAMAMGARALLGATFAVSTTGVAGPALQEGKPAGTVFVGLAGPDGAVHTERLDLAGDRSAITDQTTVAALELLARFVPGEDPGLGYG